MCHYQTNVSVSDFRKKYKKMSKGKTRYSLGYGWCQQKQNVTDQWTDRQTNDKVIPMWRFALLAPQK